MPKCPSSPSPTKTFKSISASVNYKLKPYPETSKKSSPSTYSTPLRTTRARPHSSAGRTTSWYSNIQPNSLITSRKPLESLRFGPKTEVSAPTSWDTLVVFHGPSLSPKYVRFSPTTNLPNSFTNSSSFTPSGTGKSQSAYLPYLQLEARTRAVKP